MQSNTELFYDTNAEQYFMDTFSADMSESYTRFLKYIPTNGTIADLGCGSGRDSKYFLEHQYQVDAIDSSIKLGDLVRNKFGISVISCRIEDWRPNIQYDGIWACASLLHLEIQNIEKFFSNQSSMLRVNGVLFASMKTGIRMGFSSDGRYYTNLTEDEVRSIVSQYSDLRLMELWYSDDKMGRREFRWLNFIIQKHS